MKRKILTAAMIAPMLPVSAYANPHECYVPMKDWHSRAEVTRFAESKGWQVLRVRIDDGCFEVFGVNADGIDIEARINPGSFEILKIELETYQQNEDEPKSD